MRIPYGWRTLTLSFLILLAVPIQGQSADEIFDYQVKAAYIYRIIKFVEWPEEVFPVSGETVKICLLGKDPVEEALQPVKALTVNGNAIHLERIKSVRPEHACHVLYISATKQHQVQKILNLLKPRSVLTVGDMKDFAANGGMIGFVLRSGKVRLEINVEASRQAGIKLSSKLLEVATLVTGTTQ